jgi:protein gp37
MTTIEWTEKTWCPWWGCDEIAPECGVHGGTGFCYAAVLASRKLFPQHEGVTDHGRWTGKLTRSSDKVRREPLTWRKPTLVFISSMSDIWHENAPLEWLDEVLDIMERTPQHTYQALSKRPGNIARKLADLKRSLPRNVWLGATIGHVKSLPLLKPLLRIDATVRFLSCEPLLTALPDLKLDGIGWVIAGGQSGRRAAVCNSDWVRALRDLCVRSEVPLFFKQWGNRASNPAPEQERADETAKGGAMLDGRLWKEYPR